MSTLSKKFFVMALIGLTALSICGVSYASDSENSVSGFDCKLLRNNRFNEGFKVSHWLWISPDGT